MTNIGDHAFSGCSGLTSVTISNNVTTIGDRAFSGCSGLTSVTIPNSVTSIGDAPFQDCTGLTSVTLNSNYIVSASRSYMKLKFGNQVKKYIIGESVKSIGSYAFFDCSGLTSVTIPNSVTSICYSAFCGCSRLTDVQCYAKSVPSTEDYLFYDTPIASATLHVPAASLNAYRTTEPWSGFGNIVAIDDIDGGTVEDLSELSNNKQYLIHTRNENRGTLGVIDNHLASTNPAAYGPWVCRPVVLDRNNPLITNVSQLSSPYTEPTEGSLAAMIDGDPGTFWHSVWSQGGTVEAGTHYFQVEMSNQANIDVAFKVTRRQADNDHITEWGVYGTNNTNASKANCTELAVITTPYKNRDETCVSDIFKTGGYKYLRFYINKTTRSNFGHLAEFQLYPATYDEEHGEASPFAIIQKDGGYYLYSVLDKAFITPLNDGDENANPLLPSDNKMNIYKHDDHFVFDFVDTEYTINVNFDPGISISKYGTLTNRFDDGNLFTIEEVGNFDPTEALAKFETQIATVTYNVMYEGNVVATATEQVASGDALPPAPASIDNGFVTLTKTGTHPTTVTGDVTVTYTATWNGPFEFTKTVASAKWYNMRIRDAWYVSKQDTEPYYPTQNVDEATLATPAYQWAFGGDPYHVKVYNRTTGMSETLTKVGEIAVMRSGDYTWDLLPNNDGFVLRVTGTENSCVNQFGSTSGPLQFWTSSKALTDDGSTFRVEEVVETSPAIEFADAGVKALCVANWDTNGDGELSEAEAAAVTSLGNVFYNKTNITSFNELQYFTGLTSIAGYDFYYCSSLTSINIPNSVTSIGSYAFYQCNSLTSINIPSSVTSLGEWVFGDCSSLTTATIGCSTIGDNAFVFCEGLTSATIKKSVTSIGKAIFNQCYSLTSIIVESGNTVYDSRNNCNAIIESATNTLIAGCQSTVIPNSVTSIGELAFFQQFRLNSIEIPNGVTSIGNSAFGGCTNLTSVIIPSSVTNIGEDAFWACSKLIDVWCYAENVPATNSTAFRSSSGNSSCVGSATLHVPTASLNAYSTTEPWSSFGTIVAIDNTPVINFADAGVKALCVANWDTNGDGELSEEEAAAVTSLGNVFYNKTNITSFNELQYFTGLSSIGESAFDGCTNLSSIILPEGVTTIGCCAFYGTAITSLTIPASVTHIECHSISGALTEECTSLMNIYVKEGNSRYYSENGVLFTEDEELVGSDGKAILLFPQGRSGCYEIPNDVTVIGIDAFASCKGLTSVVIPEGVTTMSAYAFRCCESLTFVTISNSVTSIGYGAFYWCSGLTDVYCYAENVPSTENSAFNNSSIASATLHVPAASFKAYSTTAPWSSFGRIVPINGFVIDDDTKSFSIAAEESGKAVVFIHQFTGDWEALYLPFAIDYDAIKADFDLAEIDGVVQNDDNNDGIADITVLSIMGFKEQMTEPNTPYLIRAKNAGEQTIVFDDVTVYPTEAATFECSSFSKRYEFTGSYNTLGASALANRYVVQGGELVKGASTLAPCRWYMTATARKGSLNLPNKIRIMPVEDVITGSPLLTSPEEEGLIYNVSGQRLNKIQKGINIKDGKKVLIK